jgi:hypothetical protein
MPVEIEQISEGYYFSQNNRKIRIQAQDFKKIPALCDTLSPIPISPAELSLLNFHGLRFNSGEYERASADGKKMMLKAGTAQRWFVGFGSHLTECHIRYVHELQRLWFALFQEHLRYSNDKITPPAPAEPDEPYYITHDGRLLIRTGQYAIWRISDKNPLFELKGRKWGLTLQAGKTVTAEQTQIAGKWLQKHLETSYVKK